MTPIPQRPSHKHTQELKLIFNVLAASGAVIPRAAFPTEDITYQSWSASAISQINNLYGELIK